MKRIIIVDKRESFLEDIELRSVLGDYEQFEVVKTISNPTIVRNELQKMNPDELIVSENVFDDDVWDYADVKITSYAKTSEGIVKSAKLGLPCYGIAETADILLECIEANKLVSIQIEKTEDKTVANNPENPVQEIKEKTIPIVEKEEPTKITQTIVDEEDLLDDLDDLVPIEIVQEKKSVTVEEPIKEVVKEIVKPIKPVSKKAEPSEEPKRVDIRAKLNESREKRETEDANSALEEILAKKSKKAETVAVYAAKGGVGKTTIACELATFLSLTCFGRGHYKVCIIDYNIDFGDVLTTLNFKNDGQNMNYWASEIKERLNAGEDKDKIIYSTEEIERRLQKNEQGLYGLIAPLTHEDSMIIGEDELEIMIRNIINRGDFDFVICDTGNNTRDSSVIALEYADKILLTTTQDVSAANCNFSFLATMEKVGFDLSKVYLVINNAKSGKETGITVKELEDSFPYQCVAKFRSSNDVSKANNLGTPLVLNQNHEFTKEMKSLSSFVTGSEALMDKPTKKRFFLFGKNRKE